MLCHVCLLLNQILPLVHLLNISTMICSFLFSFKYSFFPPVAIRCLFFDALPAFLPSYYKTIDYDWIHNRSATYSSSSLPFFLLAFWIGLPLSHLSTLHSQEK